MPCSIPDMAETGQSGLPILAGGLSEESHPDTFLASVGQS